MHTKLILKFATLDDLLHYQIQTNTIWAAINKEQCTLSGIFTEAQLELALYGYKAKILGYYHVV